MLWLAPSATSEVSLRRAASTAAMAPKTGREDVPREERSLTVQSAIVSGEKVSLASALLPQPLGPDSITPSGTPPAYCWKFSTNMPASFFA